MKRAVLLLLAMALAVPLWAAPLPFGFKEPAPLDPATVEVGDKAWVAYARGQARRATAIGVHQLLPGQGSDRGWAFDDDPCDYRWVRMEDFKAYRTKEEAAREARRMAAKRWRDEHEEDVPVRRAKE